MQRIFGFIDRMGTGFWKLVTLVWKIGRWLIAAYIGYLLLWGYISLRPVPQGAIGAFVLLIALFIGLVYLMRHGLDDLKIPAGSKLDNTCWFFCVVAGVAWLLTAGQVERPEALWWGILVGSLAAGAIVLGVTGLYVYVKKRQMW